MTLYEGKTGCFYQVKGVYVEEAVTRRLQALGINEIGRASCRERV